MQNHKLILAIIVILLSGTPVYAAPYFIFQRGIVPETENQYYLGTTTPSRASWKDIITRNITVTSGSATTTLGTGVSTFAGGFLSQASSTVTGRLTAPIASTTSFSVEDRLTVSGTGTSTFTGGLTVDTLKSVNGISITNGCFSVNGVCLNPGGGGGTINGSGGTNMLSYFTDATTIAATSTPTMAAFFATSTSIASSFPLLNTGTLYASSIGSASSRVPNGYFDNADISNLTAELLAISGFVEGDLIATADVYAYGGDFSLGTGKATSTLTSNMGRLGVGTTSPGAIFSVHAATSAPAFLLNQTGTGNLLTLQKSGATSVVVDNSGNVGIGTTNPTQKVHMYGSADIQLNIQTTSGDGNNAAINLIGGGTNANWYISTNKSSLYGAVDSIGFYKGAGTIGTKMVIQDNGNVGIGTTSPGALLSINGNSLVSNGILTAQGGLLTPSILATSTLSLGITKLFPSILLLGTSGTSTAAIGTSSPSTANVMTSSVFSVQGTSIFSGQKRHSWKPLTIAATTDVDCAGSDAWYGFLGQSTTLNFKNCFSGDSVLLALPQDGTGGRTVSINRAQVVVEKEEITATSSANAYNWYGILWLNDKGFLLAATDTPPN